MKRPRRTFAIEPLEPRTVLTASPLVSPGTAAPLVARAAMAPTNQPLEGTIQGVYQWSRGAPGAFPIVHLSGSGLIQPLGRVRVMGPLQQGGTSTAPSSPGGVLTLANRSGRVTLRPIAPAQGGVSPIPGTFAYTVQGGTGAYRHLTGNGTISLTLSGASPTSSGRLPKPGHFTLTIQPTA